MFQLTQSWYLVLGALIFAIGATGLLVRRNPLVMFMCVELMLNAVNLTFVAFSRCSTTSAARRSCSSCWWLRRPRSWSGLGIIVAIMRRRADANADDVSMMRG